MIYRSFCERVIVPEDQLITLGHKFLQVWLPMINKPQPTTALSKLCQYSTRQNHGQGLTHFQSFQLNQYVNLQGDHGPTRTGPSSSLISKHTMVQTGALRKPVVIRTKNALKVYLFFSFSSLQRSKAQRLKSIYCQMRIRYTPTHSLCPRSYIKGNVILRI